MKPRLSSYGTSQTCRGCRGSWKFGSLDAWKFGFSAQRLFCRARPFPCRGVGQRPTSPIIQPFNSLCVLCDLQDTLAVLPAVAGPKSALICEICGSNTGSPSLCSSVFLCAPLCLQNFPGHCGKGRGKFGRIEGMYLKALEIQASVSTKLPRTLWERAREVW